MITKSGGIIVNWDNTGVVYKDSSNPYYESSIVVISKGGNEITLWWGKNVEADKIMEELFEGTKQTDTGVKK